MRKDMAADVARSTRLRKGVGQVNLTTDNIHLLAVLSLDVRPSSVCVLKMTAGSYQVQVMRHEALGRPFNVLAHRFEQTLLRMMPLHGALTFDVKLVDKLDRAFEEQDTWTLATSPIRAE
jgi:hypothetical protein